MELSIHSSLIKEGPTLKPCSLLPLSGITLCVQYTLHARAVLPIHASRHLARLNCQPETHQAGLAEAIIISNIKAAGRSQQRSLQRVRGVG